MPGLHHPCAGDAETEHSPDSGKNRPGNFLNAHDMVILHAGGIPLDQLHPYLEIDRSSGTETDGIQDVVDDVSIENTESLRL